MFHAHDTLWPTLLPLQQSPTYARTLAALGRPSTLHREAGVGQVQIALRSSPFGTLRGAFRGPIWHTDDAKARVTFLRDARIRLLSDEDTGPAVLCRAGFLPILTPATHAVLTLTGDPSDNAGQKFRNIVRRAARSSLGLTHSKFDPRRDRWLLDRDIAAQRLKGYRGYPPGWTLALARADRDALHLFTARQQRRCVAAMLFIRHETTATYHVSWSNAVGRQTGAHHALMIKAAGHFHTCGVRTLDLGQIDTERAPGLARFKLSTGAVAHRLGGTWLRGPSWRR